MRISIPWLLLLLGLPPAPGAILERLTLDKMIEHSTAIVRARATKSRTVQSGPVLYTETRLDVLEQWKGSPVSRLEVSLPGGALGDLHQQFVGVPHLQPGKTYVAFLWKGPSGRVHIVGLSQGLFRVEQNADGDLVVVRDHSPALMLSPRGERPLAIPRIYGSLSRLRHYVAARLGRDRQRP